MNWKSLWWRIPDWVEADADICALSALESHGPDCSPCCERRNAWSTGISKTESSKAGLMMMPMSSTLPMPTRSLDKHEALVAADRCYFCYDAPCMTACPTAIDIRSSSGRSRQAMSTARPGPFSNRTFLAACARVSVRRKPCASRPASARRRRESLSRSACCSVMQPIMPCAMTASISCAPPIPARALSWAPVSAGLACAHRLAMKGHKVVLHDANPKAGGLNEYGIATYKSVDQFAQHEVDYVTAIGGIEIVNDSRLGRTAQHRRPAGGA